MNKESYKMREGSRLPVNGEVAAQVLRDLNKRHGAIRPTDLVDEARDHEHPLHKCFDWDDSSAAHKFRLVQARQVIRSVEITWEEPKGPRNVNAKVHSARAFVNTTRDGQGYEPLQQVLSNEEKRLRLMEQALEDLVAVQQRYESIQELGGVRIAIGEFARKVNDYERRNVKKPQRRAA
jgi:hypothetical protein